MILITGACGQLGIELASALRTRYGKDKVITSDLRHAEGSLREGEHLLLDVMNWNDMMSVIDQKGITQIYHLAAMLSATGEANPTRAWDLNMQSLINVLEAARACKLEKVFWPSSIAVFGKSTSHFMTPQFPCMEPITMYGISKLAGERWCDYYFQKYGVDVRSLRYPGIISYRTPPGGGTTDYAVSIFHQALSKAAYECYLSPSTCLPMMYVDDAVRATLELMEAPAENLTLRSGYNLSAMSFTPSALAQEIQKHVPRFSIQYVKRPDDPRQGIADSWPESIDDRSARTDWGWKPAFDLSAMTSEMFRGLGALKGVSSENKIMI